MGLGEAGKRRSRDLPDRDRVMTAGTDLRHHYLTNRTGHVILGRSLTIQQAPPAFRLPNLSAICDGGARPIRRCRVPGSWRLSCRAPRCIGMSAKRLTIANIDAHHAFGSSAFG